MDDMGSSIYVWVLPSPEAMLEKRSMRLGQLLWQAGEQMVGAEACSTNASDDMPTHMRSSPHQRTQCSDSTHSATSGAAVTVDVCRQAM